jgi:O-6-methylguanine DNA methyltransferase
MNMLSTAAGHARDFSAHHVPVMTRSLLQAGGVETIYRNDAPGIELLSGEDRAESFARMLTSSEAADVNRVASFIDQPAAGVTLDLDVGGTVFQQHAWAALCDIPSGQTRSYKDVAEGLGLYGGARAIATACAANVLAVAIPCHRVVHGDGSISGYRWGAERKRQLLAGERDHEPA